MGEMDLKTYLLNLDVPERDGFAVRCGTTRGHLQNVMNGHRPCAPGLAVAIERESKKKVTRQELRPDDWQAIWPELIPPPTNPQRRSTDHPKAAAR